jgi:hypothetical protein
LRSISLCATIGGDVCGIGARMYISPTEFRRLLASLQGKKFDPKEPWPKSLSTLPTFADVFYRSDLKKLLPVAFAYPITAIGLVISISSVLLFVALAWPVAREVVSRIFFIEAVSKYFPRYWAVIDYLSNKHDAPWDIFFASLLTISCQFSNRNHMHILDCCPSPSPEEENEKSGGRD